MTQAKEKPTPQPIRVVSGSTTYNFLVDGPIERRQVNQWRQPVPSSGRQLLESKWPYQGLIVANIINAYGPSRIGGWDQHDRITGENLGQHIEHGHAHVLRDSEAETRFGYRTLPRRRQSGVGGLTSKTLAGNLTVHGHLGGSATVQQFNDQPSVYYVGSSVSGTYIWSGESDGTNNAVSAFRWDGTQWNLAGALVASTTNAVRGYDFEIHKGRLFWLGTNNVGTTTTLMYTTAGNSWSAATGTSLGTAAAPGSRLLDDGNTLWAFIQGATGFSVFYSTDNGENFSASAANVSGQLRSVVRYRSSVDAAESPIYIMTTDRVYWLDETNGLAVPVIALQEGGRGMCVWGDDLILFLDGMRVIPWHFEHGTNRRDWSPGGFEGMPSGKAFGRDPNGKVVIHPTASGIYVVWSGLDRPGGSLVRQLCLQFTGDGWHFIWRASGTTDDVSYSARMVFLDPATGQLLHIGAKVVMGNEVDNPASILINNVEVDPALLGGDAEHEEEGYVTSPTFIIPPTVDATAIFSTFFTTTGVTSGESITPSYSADGAAGVTQSAITSNNAATTYSTSSDRGVALRTVAFTETYARTAGSGNDHLHPVVIASELSYLKMPDAKFIRVANVIIDRDLAPGISQPETIFAELATLANVKIGMRLTYAGEDTALNVVMLPDSTAKEWLYGNGADAPIPRMGTMQVYFLEV